MTVTATLSVLGTAVSASVSANMAGTSWRTVIDCSSVFGNTSPVAQSWWYCEAGDPGAFAVGWASTSWTINSTSPFNATLHFDYPDTAFEFVDGDGKGPIPPVFTSITVSE